MSTDTHSLAGMAISFAAIPMSGWSTDGPKAEKVNDEYTVVEGAVGDVLFCATGSRLYKVTFSFLAKTDSPRALEAICVANALTGGGAGVQPLVVADPNGTQLLVIGNARITKRPAPDWKPEAGPLVYELMGAADVDFLA